MWIIAIFLLLSCRHTPDTAQPVKDLLHLDAKIPLTDVDGRIDHLSYDSAGGRIFVAALGNNTVEIVDLAAGARKNTITGLHEPQGVWYMTGRQAAAGRLAVANGGNGDCIFYDGNGFSEKGRLSLGGDADNIRSDGTRLYVGYGAGGILVIDPSTMKAVADLSLKGHPESFQLDDSGHVFVNVPDENEIVKADVDKPAVLARWKNKGASANYPMALDKKDGRLFVVYRHPAQLQMLDCYTGAVLRSSPCVGDADDVFYDASTGLVFATGGEGFLDVYRGTSLLNHIATRKGARTSLWLPRERKLILAVPARGREPAALWVYKLSS